MEVIQSMLSKEKIQRLNFLARKSKKTGLSEVEKSEQAELRQEYLKNFRDNFKKQLECIEFVDEKKKN